ncbi:MAG TPA: metallophosphoesterase family protein [Polyangiaceae bacterium]|nr:metallophosphoesterase family protein [Polyangiaceae bacterium]
MPPSSRRSQRPIQKPDRVTLSSAGNLRVAVLADTHSAPHPRVLETLQALSPDAILHAGDVGDLRVLDQLSSVAKVLAVRGNIDARLPALPDRLVIDVQSPRGLASRILLLHVGLNATRLRAEVLQLARSEQASMVVCGHSHLPFIGEDHGIAVFNPGSVGPRRFGLPIVFGMLTLNDTGIHLSHVDCETGQPWLPPMSGSSRLLG